MQAVSSKSATDTGVPVGTKAVLDEAGFAALFAILIKVGYQPIGPRLQDGAVVYDEIQSPLDLPVGLSDEQEGGQYRVVQGTPGAYFEYVVGPTSWKKYLFPPKQKLLEMDKNGKGFKTSTPDPDDEPAYAFIGVRPCELAAIRIQDRVFGYEPNPASETPSFTDPAYAARRDRTLIVAVNCGRAGKTCFCDSMGTGPSVQRDGYDLVVTEIIDSRRHEFVIEAGSHRGGLILALLPRRDISNMDQRAAEIATDRARRQMTRAMVPDVENVLKKNLRHPRWDEVAARCLACGNCTMACPTCFCTTVEDTTDLKGDHAERWRLWDSCFSVDFSYIHGGSIRREGKSRYRQWMTHKLSNWHDQFGQSGCVGCGRCIAWCPVGIDITEEAKAIKYGSRRG